jgi:hypothetical protein
MMDEMLEAIQEEFTKDPPTAKVEAFFKFRQEQNT